MSFMFCISVCQGKHGNAGQKSLDTEIAEVNGYLKLGFFGAGKYYPAPVAVVYKRHTGLQCLGRYGIAH